MITQDNLKEVLEILGFQKQKEQYIKTYKNDAKIELDFSKQSINYSPLENGFKEGEYPSLDNQSTGFIIHRSTTTNFSSNENFVCLLAVDALLTKGYEARHIILEPTFRVGHNQQVYGDILVLDKSYNPLVLIENKTAGGEFSKEWQNMQKDGGQLFSYYAVNRCDFLCLLTFDFNENTKEITHKSHIISMKDNEEFLKINKIKDTSYKMAKNSEEVFNVWHEIYNMPHSEIGIFEKSSIAYEIGKNPLYFDDLREISKDEESLFNDFAEILRVNNALEMGNNFNKLVNLMLCKIYDEGTNKNNPQGLQFYCKQSESLEDLLYRLMGLYQKAMQSYFDEEIVFVDKDTIQNIFSRNKTLKSLKKRVEEAINDLNFYRSNDFAFIEVRNKKTAYINSLILTATIRLFENIKLTEAKEYQLLSNLFELFLFKGVDQHEGAFFTPTPICEFIIKSLPLELMSKDSAPKVLDFACGAGHFLSTYANHIKKYKKSNEKEYYKNTYGVENESRLSKVAKVAVCMYGQNEISIIYHNTLLEHELLSRHSFDLIISNPPYSVKSFLKSLPNRHLKENFSLFNQNIAKNKESNNAIECFFLERADSLLAKDGIAAIVLPTSILNKGGIYEKTREIILKNNDILAIVELGNLTFATTGTNTVILFFKKKDFIKNKKYSKEYEEFIERLESNLTDDAQYDHNGFLSHYCEFMGYKQEDFEAFLNQKESDIFELENFKAYKESFKNSSTHKKLLNSKAYRDKGKEEQKALKQKALIDFCIQKEKEKLLYFSLAKETNTLIIKSPQDNKEQKNFLGYEWIGRKGNEGLRELHSPYLSPLFERENDNNENKLNFLIKQALLNKPFSIPQALQPYAFRARLVDMIDFNKVEFNKAISLNPKTQNQTNLDMWNNCKYPLEKLEMLCLEIKNGVNVRQNKEVGKYKVSRIETISKAAFDTNAVRYTNDEVKPESFLEIGDILFSHINSVPHLAKTAFFNSDEKIIHGINLLRFRANKKIILPKFLFYIMRTNNFISFVQNNAIKAINQASVNTSFLKNIKIPLPPLEIQKQIVSECEKVEEQYNTIRMSIEKYNELIKAILVKAGIIAESDSAKTAGGGATSRLIASLLDSIKGLESRLDYDLLFSLQNEFCHSEALAEESKSLKDVSVTSLLQYDDLTAILDSIPTPPKEGWEKHKLIKLCNINEKTYNPSNDTNKEYLYIDIDSVEKGTGKFSIDNKMLGSNLPTRARRLVDDDSVVISTVRPYLKGFAYIKKSIKDSIFSTGFAVLKGKNNLKSKFLYILFMFSHDLMKQMEEKMPKSSYPSINTADIESLQIPLPPLQAQEKIVNAIEFIESKIEKIDSKLENLEKEKAQILERHLSTSNERERERERERETRLTLKKS